MAKVTFIINVTIVSEHHDANHVTLNYLKVKNKKMSAVKVSLPINVQLGCSPTLGLSNRPSSCIQPDEGNPVDS